VASKKLAVLAENVMTAETRKNLSERLIAAVKKAMLQGQDAQDQSAPLELVRTVLNPRLDRDTFHQLIAQEEEAQKILRRGDKITLPGQPRETAADPQMLQLQQKIAEILKSHLCLELDALALECKVTAAKVKTAVLSLAKDGGIHLINYEFAISSENLRKAHQILSDIWQAKRNIAPTDFREAMNTSRKYAMALLQYFDDQKITRRLQDGRVLLKAPEKVSQ
jgi:hypothetical protein